jgi:hypothetical protein
MNALASISAEVGGSIDGIDPVESVDVQAAANNAIDRTITAGALMSQRVNRRTYI